MFWVLGGSGFGGGMFWGFSQPLRIDAPCNLRSTTVRGQDLYGAWGACRLKPEVTTALLQAAESAGIVVTGGERLLTSDPAGQLLSSPPPQCAALFSHPAPFQNHGHSKIN